jgi:hypothetical protein
MSEEDVKKYLSSLGKKGGGTTLKKHGKEHFKKISKLAHEARWGKKAPVSSSSVQ